MTDSKRHNLPAVDLPQRIQTVVQIVSKPIAPVMGSWFSILGDGGHADPLGGWRSYSQKRVISRLIQVGQHQTNESGFAISAINKYMLRNRCPYGATGLNTVCTSDALISAKHNTHIPGDI